MDEENNQQLGGLGTRAERQTLIESYPSRETPTEVEPDRKYDTRRYENKTRESLGNGEHYNHEEHELGGNDLASIGINHGDTEDDDHDRNLSYGGEEKEEDCYEGINERKNQPETTVSRYQQIIQPGNNTRQGIDNVPRTDLGLEADQYQNKNKEHNEGGNSAIHGLTEPQGIEDKRDRDDEDSEGNKDLAEGLSGRRGDDGEINGDTETKGQQLVISIERPEDTQATQTLSEMLQKQPYAIPTDKPALKLKGNKSNQSAETEPQLDKRQGLDEQEANNESVFKQKKESKQPSIQSGTQIEQAPTFLGQEIHRSTNSILYYVKGPIDPYNFGGCLVKYVIAKKPSSKEDTSTSVVALKQDVAGLAKARALGVPTPAVFAVNFSHRLICYEYLQNHQPIIKYLLDETQNDFNDTPSRLNNIFELIGGFFAIMHNGGMVHGDLSVSHVLIDPTKLDIRFIGFRQFTVSASIDKEARDLVTFIESLPKDGKIEEIYDALVQSLYTGYIAKSARLDAVVYRVRKIRFKTSIRQE